ncbi:hypothetical protein GCM10022281_15310 [Sphingomonas rosea]|uniref:Uncharacterized protein n=1 Tax=Sphingomonas rosea TaxID=335605 RepID=A0ABP7U4A1_9SPHN
MTILLRAAFGAAVVCASGAAFAQAAPAPAVLATPAAPAVPAVPVMAVKPAEVINGTMLPSNTDVWVSLDSELSSKKAKVGDAVAFRVSRDVMMGQYVVIPRGTPARGRVSYRTGKGAFGKSAKMEFDIDSIDLNGRIIPVSGHYRIEGQGNTGAAVGAVVAVGVFGAFVTGRSATAAQGSEWKVMTKEPLAIQLAAN